MGNNYRLTPGNISKHSFSIPLYQRLFEWDKERIEQLLNDLKEHESGNPYYIGMLTATEDNALVDGQQRFTVMMLLGISLREYYAPWHNFLMLDGRMRLSFLARPEDEKYLIDFIQRNVTLNDESLPPYENIKMKLGLKYIAEYMDNNFISTPDKMKFAESVYEDLTFFVTKLPQNYKLAALNKYFERMNSTGKNLEGHEILKVRLLRKIDSDKMFYTQVWNRVSDMDSTMFRPRKYSGHTETQAELKLRITTALSLNMDAHTIFNDSRKIVNGTKNAEDDRGTGKTIEEVAKNPDAPTTGRRSGDGSFSVMNFSDFLLQCLYRFLFERGKINEETEITAFFNRANLIKTFELYLLSNEDFNAEDMRLFFEYILRLRILLDVYFVRLLDDQGEVDYDIESPYEESDSLKKLKMFEEMLYVNSSPMTYYKWFNPLMDAVNVPYPVDPELLYAKLKETDDKEHSINALSNASMTYGKIDRYWFWRLDFYIWLHRNTIFSAKDSTDEILAMKMEKARDVANNYVFKRNRSVEHIAPQNPRKDNTLQLIESIRDSFGNLVMISSSQNSSLQNAAYQEKKGHVEAYLERSLSGSIESLKMLHAFTFNTNWDKEIIENHETLMMKMLRESYDIS